MKGLRYLLFTLCAILSFTLLFQSFNTSEAAQKEDKKSDQQPVVIESKTMEMNNELKIVTFKGDVNAKKENFVIDCDKMLVYYAGSSGNQGTADESKTKIDKIVATGNVVITRAKGGTATAEKATYYQKDEKIVLTGNPIMKQGGDLVKADRITIFLEDDRSVVESANDGKVSVTISPRRSKR